MSPWSLLFLNLTVAPSLSRLNSWHYFPVAKTFVFLPSLPSLRILDGPDVSIFPYLSRPLSLLQAVFYTSHNAPLPIPSVTKSPSRAMLKPEWNIPHCPTYAPLCSQLRDATLCELHQKSLSPQPPIHRVNGEQQAVSPASSLLPACLPAHPPCRGLTAAIRHLTTTNP